MVWGRGEEGGKAGREEPAAERRGDNKRAGRGGVGREAGGLKVPPSFWGCLLHLTFRWTRVRLAICRQRAASLLGIGWKKP